jgi:hypothetical protein
MPYADKEKQTEYNKSKWANMTPGQRELSRIRGNKYSQLDRGKAKKKEDYANKKEFYQEYERNRQYKKVYGITIDDYDKMLLAQGGGCKMCGAKTGGPKRQRFAVDHCHTTGKVRGLLRVKCNVAVGFYEKHCDAIHKYLQND